MRWGYIERGNVDKIYSLKSLREFLNGIPSM